MSESWSPGGYGGGAYAPGPLGRDPRGGAAGSGPAAAGPGGRDERQVGRDGPAPRHRASSWDLEVRPGRSMPTRRRGLNWLMVIPVVMPLLVPLYNRDTPRLFGLPFFYWYQLACVLLTIVIVTFIYLMTKGRRPRW